MSGSLTVLLILLHVLCGSSRSEFLQTSANIPQLSLAKQLTLEIRLATDYWSKMSDKFDFGAWCESHSLSEQWIEELKSEEFVSLGALLHMTAADISDFNLTKKGHVRALQGAVLDLQMKNTKGPLFEEKMAEQMKISEDKPMAETEQKVKDERLPLDEILGREAGSRDSQKAEKTQGSLKTEGDAHDYLDPEVYLKDFQSVDVKYCKIIDFISGAASNVQEVNIGDGVSIKLKQGKYKLENVTPSQWIVANGRIMGKMIQEGTLSGREILDYCAYMVKIGELACR